jgi:hypothetical protein
VFCTQCANASAADGGRYFYFREGSARCESCGDEPLSLLLGLIFGIGGAAVACVIARWWLRARRREWWGRFVDAARRALRRVDNGRPAAKIVFGFFQIVAQLGETYNIVYPPAYQGIVNVLQIATFKLTKLLPVLPLQCLSPSLRDQLIFVLLAPLAVVAVAVAVGAIGALRSQDRTGLSAASLLLPSLPFVLIWSFIILVPVSSLAFRALAPCECFTYDVHPPGTDETEVCFLSTDRSVVCERSGAGVYQAPLPILGAAIVTVVVWAGAIPLLFAWFLYAARGSLSRLSPPTPLSRALGFLADGYGPRVFWWELVELGRKLLLVGFLALVQPGSLLQVFIALVVALCLFAIELYVRPFDTLVKTYLSLTTGFALVLTLVGTLGLNVAQRGFGSGVLSTGLLLAVLIVAVLVVLVTATCVLVAQLIAEARQPTIRLVATRQPPVLAVAKGSYLGFISHTCASRVPPAEPTFAN